MQVNFYKVGYIENDSLKYAVICAMHKGQLVLVRHKERTSWEIPGGHRETGENINDTASRELYEETGARLFKVFPVSDYEVKQKGISSFGRLFYAEAQELGELPELEISEVRLFDKLPENLTYPHIQPHLYKKVLDSLFRK